MPEAVIAATARTPIGRARKGSLADVPRDMAAFASADRADKVPGSTTPTSST
jgi:acetyl-CoA C-acetyltransferase